MAGLPTSPWKWVIGWGIWRQVVVAVGTWWWTVLLSPLRVHEYLLVSALFKGRGMREQGQWRMRLPSRSWYMANEPEEPFDFS